MKRLFIFAMLLVVAVGTVNAQERSSGILEGVVAKEDGSAISGAIVTAMGPQGIQTTTTDSKGRYSIRGLVPGDYQIKGEAPGFGTVVQSNVAISIGTRTQLPFTLTAGVTEEVTVVSQAPVVDLKSTTTGQTIRIDDFAPYVPLGRNIVSVFTIAPGVSDGGDPVLGSTNSSMSGSSGLENAYFIDGVNITNSGYGGLGAYSIDYGSLGSGVTYDFLEEVQVKTGGFEAEYGQAGGGIVNAVVRTGTNNFGFDASWYEEPTSFEGTRGDRNDFPNIRNQTESLRRDISVTAGGPILKDKLFYFAAYNPITIEQDFKLTSGSASEDYYLTDTNGDGLVCDASGICYDSSNNFANGPADTPSNFEVGETIIGGRMPSTVTRERTIDNYAGKVAWFATPNHKIELTAFGDPSDGKVGPQAPNTFLRNLTLPAIADPSTGATGLDWGGDQYAVKYQGVWTSNFFTEIQVSNKENNFEESGPGTENRGFFDEDANVTFGGTGFFTTTEDAVDQINIKNTHVVGPVEFSYGYQYEDIEWSQGRNYSGPEYTTVFPNLVEDANGDTGFAPGCAAPYSINDSACYTSFLSSTGASVTISQMGTLFDVTRTDYIPAGDPTTSEESNFFAQASWDALPNLTIKAGFRWTEQELTGAGNITLPICTLGDGSTAGGCSTTLTGQSYKFDSEIAPRLGVSWDVLNNGKHKLYGNFAEYYQRIPSDLAVRAFSNEVGVTSELFLDAGLTMPDLNNDCGIDTTGDGLFDSTAPCHLSEDVQGLAGGGSIILDGTQQIGSWVDTDGDGVADDFGPGSSEVFQSLHGLHTLTTAAAMKLPYTEEMLIGYAWEVNDYTGLELRLIQRELGRTLEDVQFASSESAQNLFAGETTWGQGFDVLGRLCDSSPAGAAVADCSAFPGHGEGAFGAYVFGNVGENVSKDLFPVPKRDYDAWELVYNRRMHNGWMAYANYRFAKLEGNFEGSFRNDNGQSDPFLTSLFDFPAFTAVDSQLATDENGDGFLDNDFDTFLNSDTLEGQFVAGPLNTERRHIFNGFLAKQFDFGLNVGTRVNIQSGQPRFPLFAHPSYRNSGEVPGFNPVYYLGVDIDVDGDGAADGDGIYLSSSPETVLGAADVDFNGDGTPDVVTNIWRTQRLHSYDVVQRGFFGRTPTLVTFDVNASYDFDLRGGKSKLTLLLDIFNLFNDNDAIRFDDNVETRPGTSNPDFLKASGHQAPRNVRLGAKFTW